MIDHLLALQDEYASTQAGAYRLRLALIKHPDDSGLLAAYQESIGAMDATLSHLRTATRTLLDHLEHHPWPAADSTKSS